MFVFTKSHAGFLTHSFISFILWTTSLRRLHRTCDDTGYSHYSSMPCNRNYVNQHELRKQRTQSI